MTREDDCTMTPAQWAELDAREADWRRRCAGHLTIPEALRELGTALLIGLGAGWLVSQVMLRAHGL
jgi:hypothetical protein